MQISPPLDCESYGRTYIHTIGKGKGKAVPLQAWSGPEGSRKLRFPDFVTTVQDGCKVVSLTHRPPLPPGNAPIVPEDGRNYRPKHVELIVIINKNVLWFHLAGCLYYCVSDARSHKYQNPKQAGLQAASSVHYTTSFKHSLVLLRMGKIIARNKLS